MKQPAKPSGKPNKKPAPKDDDDDDDDDDFNFDDSDSEDEDMAALLAKKKAEQAKKKVKPKKIAKSTLVLDVKPESAETDMEQLNRDVRAIQPDGLIWGGHELLDVAYGVKKLRILSTIEDDKVSVDDLQDSIESLEECQSTDIFAFNKV